MSDTKKEEVEIKVVFVNRMPDSCGECPMMVYHDCYGPYCAVLPKKINSITGNPYEMTYRRSDCPCAEEP